MKKHSAFTLLELLTVISIIALILATGIYTFVAIGRSGKLESRAGAIRAMLRNARDTARQEKGFGIVYISPGENTIKVAASKVVAYFHFEDSQIQKSAEGFRIQSGGEADLIGLAKGLKVVKGHLGKAVGFPTKESAIQIPSNALLSPTYGIEVDSWVYVEDPSLRKNPPSKTFSGDSYILQKNEAYLIRLTKDRRIEVGVRGYNENKELINYFVQTYPLIFPYSRWFHVQVTLYRGSLEIVLDQIPRKTHLIKMDDNSKTPPITLFSSTAPLLVGGGDFPFALDQLRIQIIVESEKITFPKSYRLEVEGAVPFFPGETLGLDPKKNVRPLYYKIYFNDRGELDGLYHSGPVRILLGIPKSQGVEGKGPGKKWQQLIYLGVDPSGAILSEERAKNLTPGKAIKIDHDQRKVR